MYKLCYHLMGSSPFPIKHNQICMSSSCGFQDMVSISKNYTKYISLATLEFKNIPLKNSKFFETNGPQLGYIRKLVFNDDLKCV